MSIVPQGLVNYVSDQRHQSDIFCSSESVFRQEKRFLTDCIAMRCKKGRNPQILRSYFFTRMEKEPKCFFFAGSRRGRQMDGKSRAYSNRTRCLAACRGNFRSEERRVGKECRSRW